MAKKYKNPPIVEVVCEFRFELENVNDVFLPGLLYAKIDKDFPIRKQRNLGTIIPNLNRQGENEIVFSPVAQFYSNETDKLVQVGQDLFAVNCLKKYPHWEVFKPLIMGNLNKYIEIAKPKSLKRIEFRYLNKINLDKNEQNLEDYFKYCPSTKIIDSNPLTSFIIHIEKQYNSSRDVLIMKNSTIFPEKPDQRSFLLELIFAMNQVNGLKIDEIENWLEDAHTHLIDAFESSLTDKLKATYNI